jgi:hypothetical protein
MGLTAFAVSHAMTCDEAESAPGAGLEPACKVARACDGASQRASVGRI